MAIAGGAVYYDVGFEQSAYKAFLNDIERARKHAEDALNPQGNPFGDMLSSAVKNISAVDKEFGVLKTTAKEVADALRAVADAPRKSGGNSGLNDLQKQAQAAAQEVKYLNDQQRAGLTTYTQAEQRLRALGSSLKTTVNATQESATGYKELVAALAKVNTAADKTEKAFHDENLRGYNSSLKTLRLSFDAGQISLADFRTGIEKLNVSIAEQRLTLDKSKQAYVNYGNAMERNVSALAMAEGRMRKFGLAQAFSIGVTDQLQSVLWRMGPAGEAAGVAMMAFSSGTAQASASAKALQMALVGVGIGALVGLAVAAVDVAKRMVMLDTGMTDVAKTTGFTGQQLLALEHNLQQVALNSGTPVKNLNELASVAGSLGVTGVANVSAFTETMNALAIATDIVGEAGAMQLAKFVNVTKAAGQSVGESAQLVGNVITRLGNDLAATEAPILHMAQYIGALATTADLSQDQILALAGAYVSLGFTAEGAGTSLQNLFTRIASGSDADYAALAKGAQMSVDAFKSLAARDAQAAFQAYINGLNEMKKAGTDISPIVKELTAKNQQLFRVIVQGVGGVETLNKAFASAADETQRMSAMQDELDKRLQSLSGLWAQIRQVAVAFSNELALKLLPSARAALTSVLDFIRALAGFEPVAGRAATAATKIGQGFRDFGSAFTNVSGSLKASGVAFAGMTTAMLGTQKAIKAFALAKMATDATATTTAVGGLAGGLVKLRAAMALLWGPAGIAILAGTAMAGMIVEYRNWQKENSTLIQSNQQLARAQKLLAQESKKTADNAKQTQTSLSNVSKAMTAGNGLLPAMRQYATTLKGEVKTSMQTFIDNTLKQKVEQGNLAEAHRLATQEIIKSERQRLEMQFDVLQAQKMANTQTQANIMAELAQKRAELKKIQDMGFLEWQGLNPLQSKDKAIAVRTKEINDLQTNLGKAASQSAQLTTQLKGTQNAYNATLDAEKKLADGTVKHAAVVKQYGDNQADAAEKTQKAGKAAKGAANDVNQAAKTTGKAKPFDLYTASLSELEAHLEKLQTKFSNMAPGPKREAIAQQIKATQAQIDATNDLTSAVETSTDSLSKFETQLAEARKMQTSFSATGVVMDPQNIRQTALALNEVIALGGDMAVQAQETKTALLDMIPEAIFRKYAAELKNVDAQQRLFGNSAALMSQQADLLKQRYFDLATSGQATNQQIENARKAWKGAEADAKAYADRIAEVTARNEAYNEARSSVEDVTGALGSGAQFDTADLEGFINDLDVAAERQDKLGERARALQATLREMIPDSIFASYNAELKELELNQRLFGASSDFLASKTEILKNQYIAIAANANSSAGDIWKARTAYEASAAALEKQAAAQELAAQKAEAWKESLLTVQEAASALREGTIDSGDAAREMAAGLEDAAKGTGTLGQQSRVLIAELTRLGTALDRQEAWAGANEALARTMGLTVEEAEKLAAALNDVASENSDQGRRAAQAQQQLKLLAAAQEAAGGAAVTLKEALAGTRTESGEFGAALVGLNKANANAREQFALTGDRTAYFEQRISNTQTALSAVQKLFGINSSEAQILQGRIVQLTEAQDAYNKGLALAEEAERSRISAMENLGTAMQQAAVDYSETGDKAALLGSQLDALKAALAELEQHPAKNAQAIAKLREEIKRAEQQQRDYVESIEQLQNTFTGLALTVQGIGRAFDSSKLSSRLEELTEKRDALLEGGKYDPKALQQLNGDLEELTAQIKLMDTLQGITDGLAAGFESLGEAAEDGVIDTTDGIIALADGLGVLSEALSDSNEMWSIWAETASNALANLASGNIIGFFGSILGGILSMGQQAADDMQAYTEAVEKYGIEAVEQFAHLSAAGWVIDREGLERYKANREEEAQAAKDAREAEVEATRKAKQEILELERDAADELRGLKDENRSLELDLYEAQHADDKGKAKKHSDAQVLIAETTLELQDAFAEFEATTQDLIEQKKQYEANLIASGMSPAEAAAAAQAHYDPLFAENRKQLALQVSLTMTEAEAEAKKLGMSQEEFWKNVFQGNSEALGNMTEGQRQSFIKMIEVMKEQGMAIPPEIEKYYDQYAEANRYGAAMAVDSTEEAHKKLASSFTGILDLVLQNFGPEAQAAVRKALEPFYNTAQAEIDKGSQNVAWAATDSTGGFEAAAGQILKLIAERFGPEAAEAVRTTLMGFYDGTAGAIEGGSGGVSNAAATGGVLVRGALTDATRGISDAVGDLFKQPANQINSGLLVRGLESSFSAWTNTTSTKSNVFASLIKNQTTLLVRSMEALGQDPAAALTGASGAARNAISSFLGNQASFIEGQADWAARRINNSANILRNAMSALTGAMTGFNPRGGGRSSGGRSGGGGSGYAGILGLMSMRSPFDALAGEDAFGGAALDRNMLDTIMETDRNPLWYSTSMRAFENTAYYGGGKGGGSIKGLGVLGIGNWLKNAGTAIHNAGKKTGKKLKDAGKEIKKGTTKLAQDIDVGSKHLNKSANKLEEARKKISKTETKASKAAKAKREERQQRINDAKEEAKANAEAAREAMKAFNEGTFDFMNPKALLQMNNGGKVYGRLASTFGNVALGKGLSDAQTKLLEFIKGVGAGLEQGVAGGIASGIKSAMQSGEMLSVKDTMQSLFDTTFQGLFDRISGSLIESAFGQDIMRLTEAITEGNVQKSAKIMDKIGTTLPAVMGKLNDRLAPLKATFDKFLKTGSDTQSYENLGQTIKLEARSLGSATPDWTLQLKSATDMMGAAANKQMEAANRQMAAADRFADAVEKSRRNQGLESKSPNKLRMV